jgi:hypothetical protein
MRVKDQLTLTTGSQVVTCEDCQKQMTIKVGGVKKANRRSYRPYKGTCRSCGTMYSSTLRTTRY